MRKATKSASGRTRRATGKRKPWRKVFAATLVGYVTPDGQLVTRPSACPKCKSTRIMDTGFCAEGAYDAITSVDFQCVECGLSWRFGPAPAARGHSGEPWRAVYSVREAGLVDSAGNLHETPGRCPACGKPAVEVVDDDSQSSGCDVDGVLDEVRSQTLCCGFGGHVWSRGPDADPKVQTRAEYHAPMIARCEGLSLKEAMVHTNAFEALCVRLGREPTLDEHKGALAEATKAVAA